MARRLSANSLKVLRQLGQSGKSIDELSARTGIRKDKIAKLLWHLQGAGWIGVSEEVRRLPVFTRLREIPTVKRMEATHRRTAPHITALQAAFGIRLPSKRTRGRAVGRGE